MGKLREYWTNRLWYEKIVFVICMVISVSVITLALLQLLNIWKDAAYVYMPLTAVLLALQAFENRRKSKVLVILSLCTAAFMVIVWLFVLLAP